MQDAIVAAGQAVGLWLEAHNEAAALAAVFRLRATVTERSMDSTVMIQEPENQ